MLLSASVACLTVGTYFSEHYSANPFLILTHSIKFAALAAVANLPAGRTGRRKKLWYLFYVYAIKSCERNYTYVGLTNDISRRLIEHNNGENRSTKAYRPFGLLYKEQFNNRAEARAREKYLKSGIGKEFLKNLK
jgi:putative endonuclease